MAARWTSREVFVALPEPVLRAMWDRARQDLAVVRGGTYDARSATTLLVWSAPLTDEDSRPLGAVTVGWQTARPGIALIRRVAWTIDRSGGEPAVWRALETLAAGEWPRATATIDPIAA